MSYSEGPILEFTQTTEGKWKVFSQWQKFAFDEEIPEKILMSSLEKFLMELDLHLKHQYSLKLIDFIGQ
jgi:hypothetical protein